MTNWFTVKKVDQDTFAINEYQHWEETHCYLLLGTKTSVLIDTGLGVANIKEITDRLTKLPIMAITTHVHWDHIGGLKYFEDFAVYETEKEWLSGEFPLSLQVVKRNLMHKPCNFPKNFNINHYHIFQGVPKRILHNEDSIDLGNRQLKVIHTLGHSPGHYCFYEPERKYLYSGDLIYKGCLDAFYPTTDPEIFWKSIQRVQSLDIRQVFPGHHQLHIPVNIIDRIENGFRKLACEGNLKQGSGVFDFKDFQIHI